MCLTHVLRFRSDRFVLAGKAYASEPIQEGLHFIKVLPDRINAAIKVDTQKRLCKFFACINSVLENFDVWPKNKNYKKKFQVFENGNWVVAAAFNQKSKKIRVLKKAYLSTKAFQFRQKSCAIWAWLKVRQGFWEFFCFSEFPATFLFCEKTKSQNLVILGLKKKSRIMFTLGFVFAFISISERIEKRFDEKMENLLSLQFLTKKLKFEIFSRCDF